MQINKKGVKENEKETSEEKKTAAGNQTVPQNIIMIMNESLADFESTGDLQTDTEILPFIHSLNKNVTYGKLHVPTFGGGTARSEYEALTGNSIQFFPAACQPYELYVRDPEYGLADILGSQDYEPVAMHPNNRWLYMCEEKGNKVLYFQFDEETGKMEALQELSTVPETVTGYSDASEVMIDPSGKFVIVSNRYTDSMAVYRIDPLTGYLKTSGFYPCLGKTPRFFCFGEDGKCYVANEDSDTVIVFDFDQTTGQLIPTLQIIETGSPVCITFR